MSMAVVSPSTSTASHQRLRPGRVPGRRRAAVRASSASALGGAAGQLARRRGQGSGVRRRLRRRRPRCSARAWRVGHSAGHLVVTMPVRASCHPPILGTGSGTNAHWVPPPCRGCHDAGMGDAGHRPDRGRCRPAPRTAITVRLYAMPSPSVVGRAGHRGGRGRRPGDRDRRHRVARRTGSPSTSPARRSTASTPAEIVDAHARRSPGVDRAPGQRPDLPAAPRRQDLGAVRRCRSRPATTCRWPTPRASGGCRWRWPSTPRTSRKLTIKGNAVAVVTDGSAVLGLGNLGPGAALPVMEGKAALFKRFADIDAWPICLDTQDTDEIVARRPGDLARLRRDQPGGHLGAALLRDRAPAARGAGHPGVPRRPARHGDRGARRADQRAALRVASSWPTARIVVAGGGAAGTAIVTCCSRPGRGTCWCGTARASCSPDRPALNAGQARRWPR